MKRPARPSPPPHGQHFLTDRRAIERIVSAIDPRPGDRILEIGPGGGALTEPLAARADALVAVEIDPRHVEALRARFAGLPHVTIIHADILDVLNEGLGTLAAEFGRLTPGVKVAGNLPYAIGTTIVRRLLNEGGLISDAICMLQRETAQRLLASPGSRDYGYLSVLLQLRARATGLFDLPPGAFRPPPRVHSRVIRIDFTEPPGAPCPEDLPALERVLSAAFGGRRKTLANALSALATRDEVAAACAAAGIPLTERAERVEPARLLALARALAPHMGPSAS